MNEISQSTEKAIDLARDLGGFFASLFGRGFQHLGDAFADWAAFYRYKNLLAIYDKFQEIEKRRQRNSVPTPLPSRLAIPALDHASKEDDPTLQSMWAALLANSTDPERQFNLQKIFIEILGSFEPVDAQILQFMAASKRNEEYSFVKGKHLNADELSSRLNLDRDAVSISLMNLFRNGCIIDSWPERIESLEKGHGGFRVNNPESNFRPSELGKRLIDLCNDA